jgi:hypothetical protein
MREKYWSLYETVKRSERYFFYYRERAQRRDRWIKIFLCVASLSSVANLAFWGKVPLFWPTISVIAQILSAVAYLIPYSDQVNALNSLLPELDMLIHKIDYYWDRINILEDIPDKEINSLVLDFNMEFTKLESKYTKGIPFSPSNSCLKKADSDFKKFYNNRFYPPQRNYLEEEFNRAFR